MTAHYLVGEALKVGAGPRTTVSADAVAFGSDGGAVSRRVDFQWTRPSAPQPPDALIRKTPGVLGGEARIRDVRIAVWMLVRARQLGLTDEEIRNRYRPALSQADLDAAWQYYAANRDEIDRAIAENEDD